MQRRLTKAFAKSVSMSNLLTYAFGTRTSQYSTPSSAIRFRRRLICCENIAPSSW
jgi:hypothetical protein